MRVSEELAVDALKQQNIKLNIRWYLNLKFTSLVDFVIKKFAWLHQVGHDYVNNNGKCYLEVVSAAEALQVVGKLPVRHLRALRRVHEPPRRRAYRGRAYIPTDSHVPAHVTWELTTDLY